MHFTKMELTKEGKYSVTDAKAAGVICSAILKTARCIGASTNEIVDATACNGGDTLSFLHRGKFRRVTSVEVDPDNYRCLVQNLRAAGYLPAATTCDSTRRVRVLLDDFTLCYERFSGAQIVYMDAPWGGPDYKLEKDLMLYLSDRPLDRLTRDVFRRGVAKLVCLKVPFNFAFKRFKRTLGDRYTVQQVPVRNYFLLLVHRRQTGGRQEEVHAARW